MIALAGFAGIVVALSAAVVVAVQGVREFLSPGAARGHLRLPVLVLLGGAAVAFGALELGLVVNDFSIEYVANNNSRDTPLLFTIASGWAALEGSIVLWGLVLAGYTYVAFRTVTDDDKLGAGAMAVMGIVAVFFFGLMATAANPFTTLDVAPLDGRGANPLLQNNFLMAVHPPLLYLGFVGFTVPFAFGISALAGGMQGSMWLERTRRWSLVAWSFLTLGIAMGALWSYQVLGWGGYWAWDPVENASLIPWLVGTAFIHSAIVQRRRGMLQAWNMMLVIATFTLTILGTFLTRSGVIASVHSFTQSAVGPALLSFLGVITVASLGLFAWRAHVVASSPRLESLASREGVFLANNLLLTLFGVMVLTGTLAPILVEAFTGDQVSVGRPWFDRLSVPLGFALLLAMGIGPVTPYRVARPSVLWPRLRTPIRLALVAGALTVLWGVRSLNVVAAVVLGSFVIAVIIRHLFDLVQRASSRRGEIPAIAWRLVRNDPGYWGGQIAHIGVALVAIAIAVSGTFSVRHTFQMEPGDTVDFDGYTVTYSAPFARNDPHRFVLGAELELSRGARRLAELRPSLNDYPNATQAIPSPAVRTGLTEDLYFSLVRLEAGAITLDVFRNPLMWLLWVGAILTAVGGFWPLLVRRPQRTIRPEPEEAVRV